jgi:hypothetical protein
VGIKKLYKTKIKNRCSKNKTDQNTNSPFNIDVKLHGKVLAIAMLFDVGEFKIVANKKINCNGKTQTKNSSLLLLIIKRIRKKFPKRVLKIYLIKNFLFVLNKKSISLLTMLLIGNKFLLNIL